MKKFIFICLMLLSMFALQTVFAASYQYQTSPSTYTPCNNDDIIKFRMLGVNNEEYMQTWVEKCANGPFGDGGRYEIRTTSGQLIRSVNFNSGQTTMSTHIDPRGEFSITGQNSYKVLLYSNNDPNNAKEACCITAWDETIGGSGDFDLVVDKVRVKDVATNTFLNHGDTVLDGATIQVYADMKNLGDDELTDNFFIEYFDNGVYVDDDSETSNIDPNGTEIVEENDTFVVNGAGVHTIRVEVDTQNDIAESNENNNSATFNLNVETPAPIGKDLVVDNIKVWNNATASYLSSGATVTEGDRLRIEVGIRNDGPEEVTEDFTLRFFDNNSPLGTDTETANISPNGTEVASEAFSFDVSGTGQHRFRVDIDTTDVVDELDENNNSATSFVISVEAPAPVGKDLVVDNIKVWNNATGSYLSSGATVTEGDRLRIEVGVRNDGPEEVTEDFTLKFFDNNSSLGTDTETTNISPNGTEVASEAYSFDVSGTGQHKFRVDVDTTDIVDELDENNNSATSFVINVEAPTPTGKDLAVDQIRVKNQDTNQFINSGATVNDGATLQVYVDIRNDGAAEVTQSFEVRYYDNGNFIDSDIESSDVAPNGSALQEETDTFDIDGPGQHTIKVELDTTGVVDETNESNNEGTFVVNVQGVTVNKPNLQTTGGKRVTSSPYYPGSTIGVEIKALNVGNMASNNTEIVYYISDQSNGTPLPGQVLDVNKVPSLNANQSSDSLFQDVYIPRDLAVGEYYVVFEIDREKRVDESNEGDNKSSISFTVRGCHTDGIYCDVHTGSTFDNAIRSVKDKLTNGCRSDNDFGGSEAVFCPEKRVERIDIAVFVVRHLTGNYAVPSSSNKQTFTDVGRDHTRHAWVEKAVELGIFSTSNSQFNPDYDTSGNAGFITRGQMAIVLSRAGNWDLSNPTSGKFADVRGDGLWERAAEYMLDKKYTNGKSECENSETPATGLAFCPDDFLPRQEAIALMARAFEYITQEECLRIPSASTASLLDDDTINSDSCNESELVVSVKYFEESEFEELAGKIIQNPQLEVFVIDSFGNKTISLIDDDGLHKFKLVPGEYQVIAEIIKSGLLFEPQDILLNSQESQFVTLFGTPEANYVLPYWSGSGSLLVTRTGFGYKWMYDFWGLTTNPGKDGSYHIPDNGLLRGAIDWGISYGEPVLAARSGEVVDVDINAVWRGCPIVIKHDDGTFGKYMHLSEYRVQIGQRVQAGERIGNVGNRCGSKGAHIHFEVENTQDEKDQSEQIILFDDISVRATDGFLVPWWPDHEREWTYQSDNTSRCLNCLAGYVYRGNKVEKDIRLELEGANFPTNSMVRIYYDLSGIDGLYEISFPNSQPLPHRVIPKANSNWSFTPEYIDVTSETVGTQNFNFRIDVRDVHGRVTDVNGEPIARAKVIMQTLPQSSRSKIELFQDSMIIIREDAITDENGYYTLSNLPNNDIYEISVEVSSSKVAIKEVSLDDNLLDEVNFVNIPRTINVYLPLIVR